MIRLVLASAVLSPLFAATLYAADAKKPAPAKAATAKPTEAKAHVLKFDAKEENGKKVWLPVTSTVKVNEPVTLEIHNSLAAPHGFEIKGVVEAQVIGAGETKIVTFTPKTKGDLKIDCQLHPVHVGATITVQ